MKQRPRLPQTAILLVIMTAFGLLSCGELAPSNQSGNLPANQNLNTALGQQTPIPLTPTPLPTIVTAAPPVPDPANAALPNTAFSTSQPALDPQSEPGKLSVPVAGIRREDLRDTFKDSRSEGRVHDAIDIMAACGTPVTATADGEIARFFDSERGGITIYQFSTDKNLIYYYAHLQKRADGLQEKTFVREGALLGYVGDTGNSGSGNCHLHFAVWRVTDPKRYWDGENINPFLLLR